MPLPVPCLQAHLGSKEGSWQSSPVPFSRWTNRHPGSACGLADGSDLCFRLHGRSCCLCFRRGEGAGSPDNRLAGRAEVLEPDPVEYYIAASCTRCSASPLCSGPAGRQSALSFCAAAPSRAAPRAKATVTDVLWLLSTNREVGFGRWCSSSSCSKSMGPTKWSGEGLRGLCVGLASRIFAKLGQSICRCFFQNASLLVQVASCEKGIHPARAALYRNPGPGYEFAR